MDQKKIIIVGATSGIGRQLSFIYVAKGCKVAVTGRRAALLDEIKAISPQQVYTSCFDVMQEDSPQKIQRLIDELGGLDLLIYNSGFGEVSKDLRYEIENTTTQTNVNGFLRVVVFAFNYFTQQGRGQLAVTSSVAALRGNSWAPAYSASKAFISKYAEGLNLKAIKMKTAVIVTDLRPGFMDTKLARGNGRFWIVSPQKAARQIAQAIEKRKRVVYVSKRWWSVAQLLKLLPFSIYRRLG